MLKKILFLSFFALGSLLVSCEGDQTVKYIFTDLDLGTVTTAKGIPEVTNDSVPADLFGIRLYLYPQETYRKGRYFDAAESSNYNENPIRVIKIWSNADFNGLAPGSNLNSNFIHFKGNYLYTDTIQEGGTIYPTARYYPDYEGNNFPAYTDLLLIEKPDAGLYKFYLELTFEDKSVFSDSTRLIKLY